MNREQAADPLMPDELDPAIRTLLDAANVLRLHGMHLAADDVMNYMRKLMRERILESPIVLSL